MRRALAERRLPRPDTKEEEDSLAASPKEKPAKEVEAKAKATPGAASSSRKREGEDAQTGLEKVQKKVKKSTDDVQQEHTRNKSCMVETSS